MADPQEPEQIPSLEELDERDDRRRKRSLRRTQGAVKATLDNSDGFARLRAITDEEWAEAVRQDDEVSDAA